MSFRIKLVYSTMLLPILAVILAIPPLILWLRKNATNEKFYHQAVELFWFSLMFVLFGVYPSVSRVTLSTFSCLNLGTDGKIALLPFLTCVQEVAYEHPCFRCQIGPYATFSRIPGNFMRSDFREECPSASSFEFAWSIVFTVLIPFGCPVLIAGVLIWSGIPDLARKKQRQALLSAIYEVIDLHISIASSLDISMALHRYILLAVLAALSATPDLTPLSSPRSTTHTSKLRSSRLWPTRYTSRQMQTEQGPKCRMRTT